MKERINDEKKMNMKKERKKKTTKGKRKSLRKIQKKK